MSLSTVDGGRLAMRGLLARGVGVLASAARHLGASVTSTPLVVWVYLLGALYLLNRLTYQQGIGRRRRRIGNRTVLLSSAEEALMDSVVDVSKIDTDFRHVGGLDDVKQALTEHVVWPFTHPELFAGDTVRSHPKGVLLYGPPGTGKTLLARALAKELGCSFINVHVEAIFSKWVGETERNAAAVFTLAAKLSPCVIFVDEIDALLSTRNAMDASPHTHAKTIFMTHWDGLERSTCSDSGKSKDGSSSSQHNRARIIVVGATNRPLMIDDAVRRRLPLQLQVPRPDLDARVQILRVVLAHDLRDDAHREELIQYVAQRTNQYTGSDLSELCKAAALMPLRELRQHTGALSGPVPPLTKAHFDVALKRIKASM